MAAAVDELVLLERVFLRLGSTEDDEQLQAFVYKFLPPVLLKLSSTQDGVRKKVMELLSHVNRRIKCRPKVQLPIEALLLQYQDPTASSFLINFTIIYLKMGYPRMEISKQAILVPNILSAIDGKPLSHQDSLLLMIMPVLGHINIPQKPEERTYLLGLQDKPHVIKSLLNFMLDVLLLPYGFVGQTENPRSGQSSDQSTSLVPLGLSAYAFKRITGENSPTAEQLEQTKLGIVKFICGGFFPNTEIFVHLVVAAADTRFIVANMADMELKKIVSTLDWSSKQLASPLYSVFLGSDAIATLKKIKPEMKRSPANTRIRLKLLQYLCRFTNNGIIIPTSIQVIFDSLYGTNTNPKLKMLVLQFTSNLVQQGGLTPLVSLGGVILNGITKLIAEGDDIHKPMAYTIIGQLIQRIPSLANADMSFLHTFFNSLATANGDLRGAIRDSLMRMTSAFIFKKEDKSKITLMNALLSTHIESPESTVRFVATHYAANAFPSDDIPSRYLLLLSCGDDKQEISTMALGALYGCIITNKVTTSENEQSYLPHFSELITYIHSKIQTRMPNFNVNTAQAGSKALPFSVSTFSQIITYLRICLAKSADISMSNELLDHPCEYTPLIGRYLENLYDKHPQALNYYLDMILSFGRVSADPTPLTALLEVLGSTSQRIVKAYEKELPWLNTLLISTKIEVKLLAAKILAVICANLPMTDFEKRVSEIMNMTKNKNVGSQHGALLALSYMIESRMLLWEKESKSDLIKWKTYINTVNIICGFLRGNNVLLVDAAVEGIGRLGKRFALPLPAEGGKEFSKTSVMDTLFSIVANAKMDTKIKSAAVRSLGYLCIGENFPYVIQIIDKIIATAKETKDIDIHISMGEALVYCVQGPASPESRNSWKILPDRHNIPYTEENDKNLIRVLDGLFEIYEDPHPNSRQAVSIWLLSLLKYNLQREYVKEKFSKFHYAFTDYLSDDSDLIQDLAIKGLILIFVNSTEQEQDSLVSDILDKFVQGRKTVLQATSDSQLLDEGKLGRGATSGNILTYREICSLALELESPKLVYYFMYLANRNITCLPKKNSIFDFVTNISASTEFKKHFPRIIPRLYRYLYDPNPKIQQNMNNIWREIVPSTHGAMEKYHDKVLKHITDNLTNNEWRVRFSYCNALSDLLKSNLKINLAEHASELWKKLFLVMDDIHEGTRLAAVNTTKVLSRICIRYCDLSNGKAGEDVLHAIMPILLDVGILHNVSTVREVSLQTISQLVSIAGNLIKPALVNLIPALLRAVGETENPKLSYLSNVYSAKSETQDAINSLRTSVAKNHNAIDTISKCIQYVDADILKDLMPKVIELIKSSIGFGTKIACTHFLILLSSRLKTEIHPYTGKVLAILIKDLSDPNASVRKSTSISIGHMVGTAKESSLEKMFNTLKNLYTERQDDEIRSAIALTLQSVNNYNQEILRNYSKLIIPLTFFAIHAEKTEANENTITLWTELWNDITPGTERGIKQHLQDIATILRVALESTSWTAKVQAANSITTIASKLEQDIDADARNDMLNTLITSLSGRTWDGKEKLLTALATLTCSSKEALNEDNQLLELIMETLHKESKKKALGYRLHALRTFTMVLHELNIDKFPEAYNIIQEFLQKLSDKDDEDVEGLSKHETKLKVQETLYEALGKAWPPSKETQDNFCIEFVNHCKDVLPNSTRSVQITILASLDLFVDKLVLLNLKDTDMSNEDKEMLNAVCDALYKILIQCTAISRQTAMKTKILNIILSLSRKMNKSENTEQLTKLSSIVAKILPEIAKDNQPEVRMRIVDIKGMLKM